MTNAEKCRTYRNKNLVEYRRRNNERMNRKRQENPHHFWAYLTIKNHGYNGFKINIALEELEALARRTVLCQYCGTALNFSYGDKPHRVSRLTPTLDRSNNNSTCSPADVKIICRCCNIAKMERTEHEFFDWAKGIVDRCHKTDHGPHGS